MYCMYNLDICYLWPSLYVQYSVRIKSPIVHLNPDSLRQYSPANASVCKWFGILYSSAWNNECSTDFKIQSMFITWAKYTQKSWTAIGIIHVWIHWQIHGRILSFSFEFLQWIHWKIHIGYAIGKSWMCEHSLSKVVTAKPIWD